MNETIMVKESNFSLDETKKAEWTAQAMELLDKYEYTPKEASVRKIFDVWAEKKGWLVELFRKSEFYNGNGQIIIPANIKRPIDNDGIQKFYRWATDTYKELCAKESEIKVGLFTLAEYEECRDRYSSICNSLPKGAILNGFPREYYRNEYHRIDKRIGEVYAKYHHDICRIYTMNRVVYIPRGVYYQMDKFESLISHAIRTNGETPWLISESKAAKINRYAEEMELKARAVVGQKVTKFIGKVLREIGMNKVVDIKRESWEDTNGELHWRDKDYGYNYYFALLGDSINPFEYTREVVISVNPIDYWTMSFGYKWASCHTIDKEDYRGVRENQHGGCYSGGTQSYMEDASTIVVYVRPTEKELEQIHENEMPMEEQSKFKRCLFYLGEDKLGQSRVYPDGRDGGDESLAGQLRAIMQKVISELYNTPNMWTLKKGTCACSEAIYSNGSIHYPDYTNYDDCNVSYLRRIDGQLNTNMIKVGSETIICPSCGISHRESDHITCDYCYERRDGDICERCGCQCDDDDAIHTHDRYGNEVVFCCSECAYESGYEDTIDEGWTYDNGNLYRDEWTGEYYVNGNNGIWVDEEYWYANEYNARRDGNEYADVDDTWTRTNATRTLVDGRRFILELHEEAVETPDGWYLNQEDAFDDGWNVNDNGEFVRAA